MILLTGAKGQLGADVKKQGEERGIELLATDCDSLDITDRALVLSEIERTRPEAVIHCAAYTNVNKAVTDRELCMAINLQGTKNIADACKSVGAKLVYVSTDYVFDGEKQGLYLPDDKTNPLNVYGESKLLGELAVREAMDNYFIVRTSWVFGKGGGNFIKTMLKLSEERESLTVVSDQIGSPTYTVDLASLLLDMAESDRYGTYHATNEGFCSWHELASFTLKEAGRSTRVLPVKSSDYPSAAKRPLNSKLSKQCLADNGFSPLPPWEDAVRRFLASL